MIESRGELLISDFGVFPQSADDPVLILLQLVKAISALVQRDTTSQTKVFCFYKNALIIAHIIVKIIRSFLF